MEENAFRVTFAKTHPLNLNYPAMTEQLATNQNKPFCKLNKMCLDV